MRITLQNIGKRFNTEWIFRGVDYTFGEKETAAILGRNGSGKSTLLQVVAGNMHPSAGQITYTHNGQNIPDTEIFRLLALVAPYQELIEDFELQEMLTFHFSFKPMLPGFSKARITDLLGFGHTGHKQIRQFSSGMKQRVKLVTAILSDVPLLLLDEPTMNLDKAGIEWYLNLVSEFAKNRTVIICSNLHQTESSFAQTSLHIEDFK
jgi:ABC-type multidrug transport system ATPase subunit